MPASAASAMPVANTRRLTRSERMPSARVMSRFSAPARTLMPIRVLAMTKKIAAIEALDEQAFERKPRHERDRDATDEGRQKAPGLQRQPIGDVCAQHV